MLSGSVARARSARIAHSERRCGETGSFIPKEMCTIDIASSTVFGAKFVELLPPENPSSARMYAGQVLEGQHVTVEINTVFQQPDSQIIEDVVGADVAFGPTAAGLPAEETRRRVEESLEALGLPYPEYRLRYVHALSGGQRRRVAIAGVLAMHTTVLVLDEPMAGLDPRGRRELLGLLRRLADDRDLTRVVCSASLGDVSLLCDRVVVLDEGSVAMDGSLSEVLREAERIAVLDITLPEPTAGARELRKLFPDLPADVLTEEELEAELLRKLGAA